MTSYLKKMETLVMARARHETRSKKWKLDHDLEHYFNCASSPDLASIENCWQPAKQHVRKFPHWDDASLEQLIREGWARVSQEFINERVLSMPKRLKEVKDAKGAMTGY